MRVCSQMIRGDSGTVTAYWWIHPLLLMLVLVAKCAYAVESAPAGVDPGFAALVARCAPTVSADTMSAIVSAESRGHQFAIADAGPVDLPWSKRKALVRSFYPGSVDAAVAKAEELIRQGHTVSLGVSQVNDRNLSKLGMSLRDAFDACKNLEGGGKVLTGFYRKAVAKYGKGARALDAAISAYRTGDWLRDDEGYVALVRQQIGRKLVLQTKAVVPKSPAGTQPMNNNIEVKRREFTMTATAFSLAEKQ